MSITERPNNWLPLIISSPPVVHFVIIRSHVQEKVKKRAVALQCHSQVFGGYVVASPPLAFELGTLLRETVGESFDNFGDERIALLYGAAWLIYERCLDLRPTVPESSCFILRE